ncbi:hypothetical protein [Lentzea sp. NPDC004782]|uniref:hypothetical protein n=1 Tax=Lentzea sp. NPDC004782 TaxID=3154458 RepID=UPI0033B15ED7
MRFQRILAGTAAVGFALGAMQAPANAEVAVPAPAPVETAGDQSAVVGPDAVCVFYTNGDYVHVSSTPPASASGHGWWTNGNCNATLAVVTVQLQQYYSDGKWRNIGSAGKATVRSGGGAGNRATGRVTCSNREVTGWRSVIDVDLVGLADDPSKLTTATRNITCRR